LIGIVSYLLINFWFTRLQANKAAILALTMNRVGDMGLSIGFFAIFALFGSIDYATVFSLGSFMNETAITVIGLLLLTGAMAKSANIPLHSWLPGSMEGRQYYALAANYFFLFCLLTNLFLASATVTRATALNINNLDIFSLTILPAHLARDSKGRFIGKSLPLEPLPSKLNEALVGELLGDGHLRFNKKGLDGKPKPNTNAQLAMTLKSKEYVDYLWQEIYKPICSNTPPHPWPNPNTGKPVTQYHFASKALISLSKIHSQWYIWSDTASKFTKIVPSNIGNLLTPIGLAHWIMGDGYWDKSSKTVVICTDNFTLSEVELLITVLKSKFNLTATVQRRIKSNKEICWRIRFSSKSENICLLRTLVQPYLIPSMLYKLNLSFLPTRTEPYGWYEG
jgi:hypothetical protein